MQQNSEINKRKSIRLKEFDYSRGGYYFVTICTERSLNVFGKIHKGKMILNNFGKIVDEGLNKIHIHYPSVSIDYYCIMPNHLHVIIILNEADIRRGGVTPPLPKLGNVIAYYKYQTTKIINEIRKSPGITLWQRNYYEHVIRNEKDLYEIRKYIENNPINWEDDEYYE